MSDEFVGGCIQHKDTRHVRLYNDYMDIYKGNEHKAKIIRVLETWTDSKRAEWYKANSDRIERGEPGFKIEPDFWITMSYGQFKQFMYGSISEETLKKNLTELEKAKHITRRVHPEFPYGPPQYLLNTKEIQKALNKRVAPSLVPELPQGDSLPPQEITPTQGVRLPPPQGYNYPYPGGNVTPTLGAKTGTSKNTTKNHSESGNDNERETDAARAQFDETDYHFYGTKRQHLIWNCHNWCAGNHGTCEDYVAAIDVGLHEQPTDKQAAIKIGATNGTLSSGLPGPSGSNVSHAADFPVVHQPSTTQTPVAIAATSGEAAVPPAALARQSQTSSSPDSPVDGAVTVTSPDGSRPRASDEQSCVTTDGKVTQESILDDWDAVQGQPQVRDDRLRKAARALVRASPTREELRGCLDWLPTTDNPQKPWYGLRGVGLWDIAEKLGAYRHHLALSIQPAPLADMPKPKPMDIYTANSLDKEKMKRRADEMIANARAKGLHLHDGTQ